jgi:L-fucose mutarotase
MPLCGIPDRVNADLLYALARMGHGDALVIADAHFPSDRIAASCVVKTPIRVNCTTPEILADILKLFPLDVYTEMPVIVMDRVEADKARGLKVERYQEVAAAAKLPINDLSYLERYTFYAHTEGAFAVVQTTDRAQYANTIVYKGIVASEEPGC